MTRVLDAAVYACSSQSFGDRRMPTSFELELLIDQLPDRQARIYRAIQQGRSTLYVSLLDGIADFFLHNPSDQTGYGGRDFSGVLESGEQFKVKGPWSSSCSTVNTLGLFPPLIPAAVVTGEREFERGYTFMAVSGITEEVWEQALVFLPGFSVHPPDCPKGMRDLSDEQLTVVTGVVKPIVSYDGEFEACSHCKGSGYVTVGGPGDGAWRSTKTGEWTKVCPKCSHPGGSMLAGIVPVPGMRVNRKVLRG